MSRTWKTEPFNVQRYRKLVRKQGKHSWVAYHDHSDPNRECDLPSRPSPHETWSVEHERTCRWEWSFTGVNSCNCFMCRRYGIGEESPQRRSRAAAKSAQVRAKKVLASGADPDEAVEAYEAVANGKRFTRAISP